MELKAASKLAKQQKSEGVKTMGSKLRRENADCVTKRKVDHKKTDKRRREKNCYAHLAQAKKNNALRAWGSGIPSPSIQAVKYHFSFSQTHQIDFNQQIDLKTVIRI